MKTTIAYCIGAFFLFIAVCCEYPYRAQKDSISASETEFLRTLNTLQKHYENLGISADGILTMVNTPVLRAGVHEKTIIDESNAGVAKFWDRNRTYYVHAGEVTIDGTIMEQYDDERGYFYHLHSKFHGDTRETFPSSYKENYLYSWEIQGSASFPQFSHDVESPRKIIINNPAQNIVIDPENDLVIEYVSCESAQAIIVRLTPMRISYPRNRATLQTGKAYSGYFPMTGSPIIITADTLMMYTYSADSTWDYLSLSLQSVSVSEREVTEGKKIKAIIITGDLLVLDIVN